MLLAAPVAVLETHLVRRPLRLRPPGIAAADGDRLCRTPHVAAGLGAAPVAAVAGVGLLPRLPPPLLPLLLLLVQRATLRRLCYDAGAAVCTLQSPMCRLILDVGNADPRQYPRQSSQQLQQISTRGASKQRDACHIAPHTRSNRGAFLTCSLSSSSLLSSGASSVGGKDLPNRP